MKEYCVKITDEAVMDIESIHRYISEELLNPEAANRIYNTLLDGAESLQKNPQRIKLMNSEPERDRGLRKLIVENHVIIFNVQEDVVNIIHILYGASDIESILQKD